MFMRHLEDNGATPNALVTDRRACIIHPNGHGNHQVHGLPEIQAHSRAFNDKHWYAYLLDACDERKNPWVYQFSDLDLFEKWYSRFIRKNNKRETGLVKIFSVGILNDMNDQSLQSNFGVMMDPYYITVQNAPASLKTLAVRQLVEELGITTPDGKAAIKITAAGRMRNKMDAAIEAVWLALEAPEQVARLLSKDHIRIRDARRGITILRFTKYFSPFAHEKAGLSIFQRNGYPLRWHIENRGKEYIISTDKKRCATPPGQTPGGIDTKRFPFADVGLPRCEYPMHEHDDDNIKTIGTLGGDVTVMSIPTPEPGLHLEGQSPVGEEFDPVVGILERLMTDSKTRVKNFSLCFPIKESIIGPAKEERVTDSPNETLDAQPGPHSTYQKVTPPELPRDGPFQWRHDVQLRLRPLLRQFHQDPGGERGVYGAFPPGVPDLQQAPRRGSPAGGGPYGHQCSCGQCIP